MRTLYRRTGAAVLVCAGLAGWSANAEDDAREAARLAKEGAILPLEKILERARAEHPGKVLETELEHKQGRYVYEVELLDDKGEVWELKLDAKTGGLIKAKRDD